MATRGDFTLIDVEVSSALRRRAGTSRIDRIWELRRNFTAYDAAYVALAEITGAQLYIFDSKLLKGRRAKVVYFGDWIT